MRPTRHLHKFFASVAICVISLSVCAEPIDLLIAVIEPEPVQVNLFTAEEGGKAGMVGMLTGGIGGAFYGLAIEERNKRFAAELTAQLDPSWNRTESVRAAIENAFSGRARAMEFSFGTGEDLVEGKRLHFDRIARLHHRFVLLIRTSTAYRTSDYNAGLVTPGIVAKVQLIDAHAKILIWSTDFEIEDGDQLPWQAAIADAAPLARVHPACCTRLAYVLYERMLREDAFHKMAKGTANESEYPEIKKLLKREAERFIFKRALPKDWKSLRSPSPYFSVTNPKDIDQALALSTEIDLLIPELGQDFDTLDEYANHRAASIEASPPIPLAQTEFDLPALDSEFVAYFNREPNGTSLIVHRKFGRFVVTHVLASKSETPEQELKDTLDVFQKYIRESKFILKSGK